MEKKQIDPLTSSQKFEHQLNLRSPLVLFVGNLGGPTSERPQRTQAVNVRSKVQRKGSRVIRRAEVHEFVKTNNLDGLRGLFTDGSDVNERDEEGWTPIMWAARVANSDAVKLLHEAGADLVAANDKGSTALHHACHWKSEEIVQQLLQWLPEGEGVNTTNVVGWTPLHWAAKAGSAPIAKMLLDAGANPDARHYSGGTPLHEAANSGDVEVAKVLLDSGADVNMLSNTGASALLSAAYLGRCDLCELLIHRGADMNVPDEDGITALTAGARGGSLDVVEVLIEANARIDDANGEGWTALHEASRWGRDDVVELLITKGAGVNVRTVKGETPLHMAAMYGSAYGSDEIAKQLIQAGADPMIADESGRTARDIALEASSEEASDLTRILEPATCK